MLSKLIINNVALVSSLSMELDGGLTILTGETGAGKSIIVDSLMLLLGGKYDKTLLKYGKTDGFVEGLFSGVDRDAFSEIGLDEDEDAVIRRRFNQDGKNDIRINGQSVTLAMLKKFALRLVDIYGQNEHQSLANPSKHLEILDYYVRDELCELLPKLDALVKEFNETKKKLSSIGNEDQRRRNIDMLKYQIAEIKEAEVGENDENETLERRKILLSSERIKTSLSESSLAFSGENDGVSVYDLLRTALKSLSYISSLAPKYEELYSRVDSLMSDANDIGETLDTELNKLDFEENDLDALEKRLEVIRDIKRKYGDYAAMQKFLKKAEDELDFLLNADSMYEKLLKVKENTRGEIYALAKKISSARKACAVKLEQRIIKELSELGMKDSRFQIVFSEFPSIDNCDDYISRNGMDKVEFYLSANLGQPLLPLAKIISGGEMSRFMLALKVISSDIDAIQTMIFDEIDAGISGAIGRVIAQKLAAISRKRQVICVTHLPQIAAMADTHYFINKEKVDEETLTSVTPLKESQMIEEISRLSGGKDISSQSLASAKEIKDWSTAFKQSLK